MKFLLFIALSITSFPSWSQHIYGSVSGGYLYNSFDNQSPSYIVNTYQQVVSPWFWRQENYSFQNILHADMHFGHMFTKNMGYELSGSYVKPMDLTDNSENIKRIMKGNFFQASLKVVLSVPMEKFDVYTKIGLNLAGGKMNYSQRFKDPNASSSENSEEILEYAYRDPFSLGFNGTLGMNFPISKRVSIFTEMNFIQQLFTPKQGKIVKNTSNGKDLLANSNPTPYYSQIEFGNESEWYNYTSTNTSQAQKLYKRAYSIGGYGLTIGVKFILWQKKHEDM